MADEKGYVKYQCNWIKSEPVDNKLIEEINFWRSKLHKLGLIGAYPNGIGFGNISIRLDGKVFLITGTATGHLETLTVNHFTKVTAYHFKQNKLTCEGPIQASAESLSHAAVYEADKSANAVIHIHNKPLWLQLLNKIPTTSPTVEYGTPQMALEIHRLFKETELHERKILVMAGHEEGIIAFGKNLNEAGEIIMNQL
jgi:ribulose-5-phosphate 4-epimerase/fuculose-1-phosphate aldolase